MASVSGGGSAERKLSETGRKLGNARAVRVGFFAGSTEPNGQPTPLVAALDEFGTRRMPPRPYFRTMIAEKHRGWAPALAKLLKASDYDSHKALAMLGEGIEGQLKESITARRYPPLAPSTIARKGFDQTLVDSAVMLNSVTSRVE